MQVRRLGKETGIGLAEFGLRAAVLRKSGQAAEGSPRPSAGRRSPASLRGAIMRTSLRSASDWGPAGQHTSAIPARTDSRRAVERYGGREG